LNATIATWRRLWRLNAPSRKLVIEAALVLAATWVGIRVAGYRRWKSVLESLTTGSIQRANSGDSAVLGSARAIARFQGSAARHLFLRTNCLEQSLALCCLLHRRGIGAELRIGARKEDNKFEAHAWVELGGEVLSPVSDPHRHFEPFDRPLTSLETETL